MGRRLIAVAALLGLGLPWGAAQAGTSVVVGFGVPYYPRPYYHHYYYPGYRVYVAPPPVYVAPAPAYVVPAQPVYVQPAPTVYQAAPGQYVAPPPAAQPAP
ncbi:MAG TPA: hypothetical protein VGF55_15930, partial [Gemmataceae bacterium]